MNASNVSRRPFYGEYAWAFDLLIERPVRRESAVIAAWLIERGINPGADVLDAGCGSGRYGAELARRGYVVEALDQSAELIDVALRTVRERPGLSFRVGNILELPTGHYDAILCRGVLNDLVEPNERKTVFGIFARALRSGGVLILDVREWEASAERKAREPLFRKRVATDRGLLTFTSITELDRANRQLLMLERHTLSSEGRERSSDYRFVMQCWMPEELDAGLQHAGFSDVAYFGAYDPEIKTGATDRLVAVARLRRARP